MPFELQTDTVRPEVQQGVAGTISLFPTVAGQRVEVSSASYEILQPGGAALASGTVTPTAVTLGSRTVSRLDVPIAAISTLDEDYVLKVTWTASGATVPQVELLLFDVVIASLGESVSLSDLREERADVEDELDTMGQRLGFTAGQTAQEAAAQVLAKKARTQLFAWLRSAGDKPRPFMIIDRRPLNRVERMLCLRELYASFAHDPEEGERTADSLHRFYSKEARATFESLHIAYSSDDDVIPDETAKTLGKVFSRQRVQS